MHSAKDRTRLTVIGSATVAFLFFVVRGAHLPGEPLELRDVLFVFAIFGIPFLVFVFMVWSSRWDDLKEGPKTLSRRNRIAFAAEALGGISSALFLLNLPFWNVVVVSETLGGAWVLVGILTAILAIVSALVGSPRRWMHAVASALLLPCWLVLAALFLKASLD